MATAKAIKSSLFGFLSIALMSAPAFAQNTASVTQTSDQSVTQQGNGNVAVQGNVQTGIVNQNGHPYGGIQCFAAPCPGTNDATIHQANQQSIDQQGNFNQAIQGNMATATVNQGGMPFTYPYYPFGSHPFGSNSAAVNQTNGQSVTQVGHGNQASQGNAASATVNQP
jgi:hypothetical protein